MGSVHSYAVKTDSRPRWLVSYRDPANKQKMKRGFARKADAERYLRQVETAKDRGEYVDPSAARATVAMLAEPWLKAQSAVLKPSSYRPVESAWRTHVRERWADREIGSIRHSEVQAWVSELSAVRSATTVHRAYGVLAAVIDVAVKDRRVTANAARDVKLPRPAAKRKVYLSHEQVERLALASRFPDLVRFLAYSGLRWGEATALRLRHVDAVKRRVTVEENAVMVGSYIEVGTPKTHEIRSVPYPAFLDAAIATAMQDKRSGDLLWGDGQLHMRLPNSRDGWFAAAVKRVRAADPDFPRVTPHDLRHAAVSLAISAGANVKAIQRMVGHASAAMTLDQYADLFEDDLDAVAASLDQARARALVSTVLSPDASQT